MLLSSVCYPPCLQPLMVLVVEYLLPVATQLEMLVLQLLVLLLTLMTLLLAPVPTPQMTFDLTLLDFLNL